MDSDMEDAAKTGRPCFAELENLELKATVEGQEKFIRQLRDELRVNGEVRESTSSMVVFENGKQVFELEDQLRDKDIELSRFQEELGASRQTMELSQRQYEDMKAMAGNKESEVRKLRQDVESIFERFGEAQKEKSNTVEKLSEVQTELSSLAVENEWLRSQLKLAERSLKDIGKDPGSSRFSKKLSHNRNENFQELLKLTSEYETLLKSSEFHQVSSSGVAQDQPDTSGVMEGHAVNVKDDRFIRDMNKRMEAIEKRVKEAVISEKYQISAEKEFLIQEFKNLQKTLSQQKRIHDSYAKDVEAKDSLIKRLKSIKESLESEVDGLRQELIKVKEECDHHVKEKHVDNMKLIATKSQVSFPNLCLVCCCISVLGNL